MYTNCLAYSCRKSISTAPGFDLSLRLSITFQMITGSEVKLHVKCFSKGTEKLEMNSGLWSEVTCSGMLCLENMCITNSIARSLEVQWMVVRMNMPCLESWSTITRIELQPEDVRRVSMKSIEMEFHRCSGIGSCFSKL